VARGCQPDERLVGDVREAMNVVPCAPRQVWREATSGRVAAAPRDASRGWAGQMKLPHSGYKPQYYSFIH